MLLMRCVKMLVSNKVGTWFAFALIASALGLAPARANAGFLSILDTDAPAVASYLAATTEMSIPGSTNDGVGALTGPDLTITFGSTLKVYKSPDWPSWSGSTAPDVLGTTVFANSVTLDFSAASTVTTFGFEAEPAPWQLHDITAEFFNGANSLGSITFNVDGDRGARLFAATLDNFGTDLSNIDRFTRVVVSSDVDFGIGHIRYAATSSPVPEPGTIAMLWGGFVIGLPALVIRRRRAKQHS
jgi:hypothetical protein